jgi:hypothetical protein
MAENLPEFDSDQEAIEWFKSADLDEYDLQEALEVSVASKVGLTFAQPWHAIESPGATTGGAVGEAAKIDLAVAS